MIPTPDVAKLELRDYIHMVTSRIWIVALAVLIGVLLIPFLPEPVVEEELYRARATISIGDAGRGGRGPRLQAILRSRLISEKVIESMDIDATPDELLKKVRIEGPDNFNVTAITVTTDDPAQAVSIAETWIREFIDFDVSMRERSYTAQMEDIERSLGKVSGELVAAERELLQFEAENREIRELADRIKDLNGQIARLLRAREERTAKYTEEHPRIVYIDSEIAALRREVDSAQSRMADFDLSDQTIEHRVLKEKAESHRKMYSDMVNKSRQMERALKELTSEVFLLDDPVAVKITKPLEVIDPIVVLAVAFMLGLALCFLLEFIDKSLKRPEEVEFYAKIPFFGYVPQTDRSARNNRERSVFFRLAPHSRFAEGLRNIKAALLFASEDGTNKTILVTSALPGEGRSCIASNLAITFAASGEKVLLIDADMMNGRLKDVFYIEYDLGLSDVLMSSCRADQAVLATHIPGLSLMSAGSNPENASDLLGGEKFRGLIGELSQFHDRIIIDCSPALPLSDSSMVARSSDSVIFVIKHGKTVLKDVKEAFRKVSESKDLVAGAVLNRAHLGSDHSYFRHYFEDSIKHASFLSRIRRLVRGLKKNPAPPKDPS